MFGITNIQGNRGCGIITINLRVLFGCCAGGKGDYYFGSGMDECIV